MNIPTKSITDNALAGVWNEVTAMAVCSPMTAGDVAAAIAMRRQLAECPGFRKAKLLSRSFFRHARERMADPTIDLAELLAIRDLALEFQNDFCERKLRAGRALGELIAAEEAGQ